MTPHVACDKACDTAHRVYYKCCKFASEAFFACGPVVEYQVGCPVKDLTDGRASDRGRYDVVGRRVFAFHKHFPHGASSYGKQFGCPEIVAV